jgi:hypothetical protein
MYQEELQRERSKKIIVRGREGRSMKRKQDPEDDSYQ